VRVLLFCLQVLLGFCACYDLFLKKKSIFYSLLYEADISFAGFVVYNSNDRPYPLVFVGPVVQFI